MMILNSALPSADKMEMFLAMYADLPDYGLLWVIATNWFDFTHDAHDVFWCTARIILSQEAGVGIRPLEYALAVDFFEDGGMCRDAWFALVDTGSNPTLLRRVLANSGPVPSSLREPLYSRLIADPAWHGAIFLSLLRSKGQYQMQEDKQRALAILNKLDLPTGTPQFHEHQALLNSDQPGW